MSSHPLTVGCAWLLLLCKLLGDAPSVGLPCSESHQGPERWGLQSRLLVANSCVADSDNSSSSVHMSLGPDTLHGQQTEEL